MFKFTRRRWGETGDTKVFKDAVNKKLSETFDGQNFLSHWRNHPQDTVDLAKEVRRVVAHHGMSVSAAKGFFEYMKIIVEKFSFIKD